MKKYQVISTLLLVAVASLNCAQIAKKKEAELSPSSAAVAQLLWQYDTGAAL